MTNSTSAPEVLDSLKRALKARRITYAQVASHLGISEQSVKRIFREGDCSLARIAQICSFAGISLPDLFDFASQHIDALQELTPAQSRYLSARPGHFTLLFLLSIGETLADIQETYKLSDQSTFKYLRDLSRNDFIELGANNHITLRFKGQPMMRLHGPMHELVRNANILFLNHAIDNDGQKEALFSSTFRRISTQTLEILKADLAELTRKYRKLAQRDAMIIEPNKLKPVKWSIAVANFSPLGTWPLTEYKDNEQKDP